MINRTIYIAASLMASATGTYADNLIVWSEFDAQKDNIGIFLRREANDGTSKEHIIAGEGTNLTPSMAYDDPLIWLTWADRSDIDQYALRYAIVHADSLETLESGKIETHDQTIYAPAITVGADNTAWIAWASFDGHDEEIKLAHYDRGQWSKPSNMTQNETPDSTPRFETQIDGSLSLAWAETTKTEVVTRRTPLESLSIERSSTNQAFAQANSARRIYSQQHKFDANHNFPAPLSQRKKDVLMGNQIDIPE